MLSYLTRAHIFFVNLEQESTSREFEMEHEDELKLGDITRALKFRPKRKMKKCVAASNNEDLS